MYIVATDEAGFIWSNLVEKLLKEDHTYIMKISKNTIKKEVLGYN